MVCFNCFKGGHGVSEYTYKSYYKKCEKNYNTLIHYEKKCVLVSQEISIKTTAEQCEQEVTMASICVINATSTFLLSTALINLIGVDGN